MHNQEEQSQEMSSKKSGPASGTIIQTCGRFWPVVQMCGKFGLLERPAEVDGDMKLIVSILENSNAE